jgi:predicted TIM-barrel fold metal-dependent hydrolase
MTNPRIDAHSHFFNAKYALQEVMQIIRDRCTGGYESASVKRKRIMGSAAPALGELEDLAEYIAGLLEVTLNSTEENWEYELEAHSKVSFEGPLWTVPMMMDIYYIFDKGPAGTLGLNMGAMGGSEVKRMSAASEVDMDLLQSSIEGFKQMVQDKSKAHADKKSCRDIEAFVSDGVEWLSGLVDDVGDVVGDVAEWLKKGFVSKWKDVEMSKGYEQHMEDLMELQKKNKGTVFPFLAIDPRRPGAINLLTEYNLVSNGGPFYGVKLYPALGYLPSHPNLMPVYAYCTEHSIPVSAHCSSGGFPTRAKKIHVWGINVPEGQETGEKIEGYPVRFSGEHAEDPSQYFGHPDQWRPVLEEYASHGLRVNLCHFGGENSVRDFAEGKKEGGEWTHRILELMHEYPENVYVDTAYHTLAESVESIRAILRDYSQAYPVIQKNLMFGTDYVMIQIEKNLDGIEEYFSRFKGLIEIDCPRIAYENPKRFLGI